MPDTHARERRRAELSAQYEAIAIRLFAERGFRNVTVAEVAAACGVTSRTLFRYFPTKEEMLLTPPRRVTQVLLDEIAAIEPTGDPVASVWDLLVDMTVRFGAPIAEIDTWYRAAADIPEVVVRMRGERARVIEAALTTLFATAMGVDPTADLRPRVLAASTQAAERAVLDHYRERGGRDDLVELFRQAYAGLRGLAATLA